MADAFDQLIQTFSPSDTTQASADPMATLQDFVGNPQQSSNNSSQASNDIQSTPPSVQQARQYIGQQSYNGLCQQFAEAITDHKTGEFPSAVDAFNSYAQNKQAYQGLAGAKPGDLVYFSPNAGNGNFGHVGIYSGGGNFISATDNGVQELPIADWLQQTNQQLLGYVPK